MQRVLATVAASWHIPSTTTSRLHPAPLGDLRPGQDSALATVEEHSYLDLLLPALLATPSSCKRRSTEVSQEARQSRRCILSRIGALVFSGSMGCCVSTTPSWHMPAHFLWSLSSRVQRLRNHPLCPLTCCDNYCKKRPVCIFSFERHFASGADIAWLWWWWLPLSGAGSGGGGGAGGGGSGVGAGACAGQLSSCCFSGGSAAGGVGAAAAVVLADGVICH